MEVAHRQGRPHRQNAARGGSLDRVFAAIIVALDEGTKRSPKRSKHGRTRLEYKAEHVVDLESEILVKATVHHGTEGDAETLLPNVVKGQIDLVRSGSDASVAEVVADTGYHKNETLAECRRLGARSYIPDAERGKRRWSDKPPEWEAAIRGNRRRVRGKWSKRLQRLRSERPERSFAHLCDTGGARRSWLRGLEKDQQAIPDPRGR